VSDLLEAWRMSCEANLFLLGAIPPKYLHDAYSPRTRSVGAQFAHIHNVRLRWLKHAAPKLAGNAKSFPRGAQPTKAELKRALKASDDLVVAFLAQSEAASKVPQWNGGPASFLGYLVAHEAHHRGLAMVAMRLSGRKLPQELVYGLWQWGKRRSLRG